MAVVAEGFLDSPIRADDWTAGHLATTDPLYEAATRAWADAVGATVKDTGDGMSLPPVDLVAITGFVDAEGTLDAIERLRGPLSGLLMAIWFRHMRGGRTLAWIASDPDSGETTARFDYTRTVEIHHEVENLEAWEPAAQVVNLARMIGRSPVGQLLAEMFTEANRELSDWSAIARLWTILEVLAGRFDVSGKREKLRRVELLMQHLGLVDIVDLGELYGTRNDFVHEGKRRPNVSRLRLLAAGAVLQSLARSSFQPVDPTSAPYVDDPAAPHYVLKVRYPAP